MKKLLFLIIFFVFFTACFDSGVEYREERSVGIARNRIKSLEIRCVSGDLDVNSVYGISRITATAEITINEKDARAKKLIEKNLVLTIKDHGSRAVLTAELKNSLILFYKTYKGRMHVNLRVPSGLDIKIVDKKGGIYASNIRNKVTIVDGEGDIDIENMRGDLEISDKAGEINIENLTGNLRILDIAGKIRIKNATGKIRIDDRGGDIELTHIRGNIELKDTSGKIFIENVKGNVEIKESGKGDVLIKNVTGMVIQKD